MVRKSELLLAEWEDVHLDLAEWHIPAENSKTGKPPIVYLPSQAKPSGFSASSRCYLGAAT